MSTSDGVQQATFAVLVNQDLTAAPLFNGTLFTPPNASGSLAVLLTAQADPKQGGLYDVSKVAGVITYTRRLLTARDCQVQVGASGPGQGLWVIVGLPTYGTDDVTVRRPT